MESPLRFQLSEIRREVQLQRTLFDEHETYKHTVGEDVAFTVRLALSQIKLALCQRKNHIYLQPTSFKGNPILFARTLRALQDAGFYAAEFHSPTSQPTTANAQRTIIISKLEETLMK